MNHKEEDQLLTVVERISGILERLITKVENIEKRLTIVETVLAKDLLECLNKKI